MTSDYEEVVIDVKGTLALIRLETTDEFIVREIFHSNTYRKLDVRPDDVVLDVGMNIGAFTIYALQKGAFVHSFEPEPKNFSMARHNILLNKIDTEFILHQKAVVGNDDAERPLSINVRRNKGLHSLIPKRGRDTIMVSCMNINHILQTVRPTVIKMDIEGGEYECLKAVESFKGVREMIFEFHHAHLNDVKTKEKYKETTDLMRRHFKTVQFKEDTKGAWVSLVYCNDE